MGHFFRNLRLLLLIFIKFSLRKWKKILVVIIAILFFLTILFVARPFRVTSLSEGIVGTYQSHDLPESVTHLLSRSLVLPEQSGKMKGDLVSGWDVNNDLTIYKFKLKDTYWSDGTKIKSDDIEFGIQDVEVSYPDDQTIQFKLKSTFSAFPSLLTKPVFKKGTLIGTGPYKVEKQEKSRIFLTKLVLKKVDAAVVTIPEIIIRFYPNEKTARLAYELGEVQSLVGINDVSLRENGIHNKLIQKTNFQRIIVIFYNTKDPLLSNRSLRQALSYSAPEIKNEVLAKTPLNPLSWAYTGEVNDYLENHDAAKAALDRAKNSSSSESFKKEIILTSTPQLENIGKQIISSWNSLGIKAVLRIESGIPQNFQALLISQSIPSDPDQYSLWHSTQTKTNLSQYSSARVDKDLEDGRKLSNEEERKLKYIDFQKTLLEDSPAAFLYFPKYNILFLSKIEDDLNKVLAIQFPDLKLEPN